MTANLGPIVQCKVTGSVVNYPCDVVGRCDPACAPGNMDAPSMNGVWGPPIELPVHTKPLFRRFTLERDADISGVSGTGTVAEGVEFSNGVVALHWTSEFPTSVVFHHRGMESVEHVHGHSGATRIVWLDS